MSGELILIIDDSREIIRHLTERLLPTFGFKTIHAYDGRSGLDLIRQEQPDLVMIDLNLPEMTGLDVLQKLAYESIEVPTILMTGYGSEKSAIEAFRLGVRDYLIKPFTVDEVLETINRALMEKRLRQDKQQLTTQLQLSNIEIRRQLSEMNNIIGIGKSITAIRDLDQVIERALESAIYVANAEESGLWLLQPDNKQLSAYSKFTNAPSDYPELGLATEHPLMNQVVRDGQIVRDASFSGPGIKIKTGYFARSLLYVPLTLRGAIIGALGVMNRNAPRAFSERDEEMLTVFADFAAIAIENAKAYKDNPAPVLQPPGLPIADAVSRMTRAVASDLSLEEFMRFAIRQLHELWHIEGCSIWILNEARGALRTLANSGAPAQLLGNVEVQLGEGLVGHSAQSGKWVYTNQAKNHHLHFKAADEKTGFKTNSLLCVPLIYRKKVIGALELVNKQTGDFETDDVEQALQFASPLSVGLANALINKQLENRKIQLDTILYGSNEAIVMMDNDLNITLASQRAQELLQPIAGNSWVGKPISELFQSSATLRSFVEQPLDENQMVYGEFTISTDLAMAGNLISIPKYGRALILMDITPLKRIDESKSDFVSTVSHDLRAPLTSAQGFVRALGEVGPLNEKQQIYVGQITEVNDRMLNLVDDLLELARVTSGIEESRVVCSVVAIVREVALELQGKALNKNVSIELDLPTPAPTVLGDPLQIRRAISNLMDNAIKYTEPNSAIRVSAKERNEQLILQVVDQGPGIEPKDIPLVFDRFYRAPDQDKNGTGLGLALTRSIVEAHAGTVYVESMVGKGAVFTLQLPAFGKGRKD